MKLIYKKAALGEGTPSAAEVIIQYKNNIRAGEKQAERKIQMKNTEKLTNTERMAKNIEYLCRSRGIDEDALEMHGIDTFTGVMKNWAIEALCDTAEYFDVPVELLLYADLEKMGDPARGNTPALEDDRLICDHLMQAIETAGEMCESCTVSGDTTGFLHAAQVLAELVMARSEHMAETAYAEN